MQRIQSGEWSKFETSELNGNVKDKNDVAEQLLQPRSYAQSIDKNYYSAVKDNRKNGNNKMYVFVLAKLN